jgi:hypothetical protein
MIGKRCREARRYCGRPWKQEANGTIQRAFGVRRPANNAVHPVSRTQELGDVPTHAMIPRIMARFDAYQSKENAKHTLRAIGAERAEEAIERARPSITAESLRTFALAAQAHAHCGLPREAQKMAGFGVPSLYRTGVPRRMKMGTIASPWRYDAMRVSFALYAFARRFGRDRCTF